ncbi:MAG: hypothetical protein HGB11_01450 [Chlorobiales bacterium]|nr:hypothetical protein [Chlorobiales bacterium]
MKEPILFRRKDCLSYSEANYWKDLLYRVVKIGTELEVAPPKGIPRPEFEETIRHELAPSGSFDQLGPNGVLDVQPEHCGIEIRVIGRHPYYQALLKQYSQIMRIIAENGGRSRPTCGLHYHLLTPTLAEPVPEIILANLWNLVRRYAPELKYMTSCGDSRGALTRRRNHNSHLEMVRHSPDQLTMAEIQSILKASKAVPEHQNFLNLEHIGFYESGGVLPLHLEFRFPDASLSPSAVTAFSFLFLAMLLKAVDLAQYGVVHVGKITTWQHKQAVMNMLSNNDGELATSDTSKITDEILEELRQGSHELLSLLESTFDRFTDKSISDVLHLLADEPVSLQRCAGKSWDEIEAALSQGNAALSVGISKTDQRLMRSIELCEWSGLPSQEDWKKCAAEELYLSSEELQRCIDQVRRLRGLRWDERKGTLVFTS